MPDEVIKTLKDRLSKARELGQEYHGEVILKIANNKFVSVEKRLEIKEHKNVELAG